MYYSSTMLAVATRKRRKVSVPTPLAYGIQRLMVWAGIQVAKNAENAGNVRKTNEEMQKSLCANSPWLTESRGQWFGAGIQVGKNAENAGNVRKTNEKMQKSLCANSP